MYISAISDTHSQTKRIRHALEILQNKGVRRLIHCGDIDRPEVVPLFNGWEKLEFVAGNMDQSTEELAKAVSQIGGQWHGEIGSVQWQNRRIAFLHGHQTRRLHQVVRSGQWDLVLHGHTHVSRIEKIGSTLVVNPGALHNAARYSVALIDLKTMNVELIEVPF